MYREVTMVEVTEVLRLWRAGLPRKRLAAQLGLDIEDIADCVHGLIEQGYADPRRI